MPRLNNEPVYIIYYPVDSEVLDLAVVEGIVGQISNYIHVNQGEENAHVIALPNEMSLRQMSIPDLRGLHEWLGEQINNINHQEEET